ncbi:hypothetical protein HWV62_21695 [Athelia sp. TMB]|nr:hypothetical protein HWV62_21695 [Athelia sp. TMB]
MNSSTSSESQSSETTPLLLAQHSDDSSNNQTKKITPLPKPQLAVVTCIRLAEPIAYSQIFPYINEFIGTLHVTEDPKQIGFYSGVVESIFALSTLGTTYYFARLSDRVGRRPIILGANLGCAIATFCFGLNTSLRGMLISRAVAGVFSGGSPVNHAVISELTDSTNFGLALPIYSLAWPTGLILGPMLGGSLAHPAEKMPWLDFDFLRRYPFFLPGGVSSLLTILAVFIGYFILQETLPSKTPNSKKRDLSAQVNDDLPDKPSNLKELLSNPIILSLSTSGFSLSFMNTGFQVIFALFSYTSILDGGLGLSVCDKIDLGVLFQLTFIQTGQIGYALSVSGAISLGLQLMIMPYLIRTFNRAKMYNLCFWMFPFIFPLLAALNIIARLGFDETTGELSAHASACVWVGIAVALAMCRFANLAFG